MKTVISTLHIVLLSITHTGFFKELMNIQTLKIYNLNVTWWVNRRTPSCPCGPQMVHRLQFENPLLKINNWRGTLCFLFFVTRNFMLWRIIVTKSWRFSWPINLLYVSTAWIHFIALMIIACRGIEGDNRCTILLFRGRIDQAWARHDKSPAFTITKFCPISGSHCPHWPHCSGNNLKLTL